MLKINDSISLNYIPMEKLKTSTIGVYIHRSLNECDASKNALLPYVLKRGCRICPDREAMERYLDELYGATFKTGTLKKGEDHVLYFTIESISEKYASEKEALFRKMLRLILSVVFEPVTDGTGFSSEFAEQEKKNLTERIESIKNDKRTYASVRCTAEMFAGNEFAIPSYGTVDGVKSITSENLYEYYKDIIGSSKIDIYVSGECDEPEAAKEIEAMLPDIEFKGKQPQIKGSFIKSGDVKYVEEKMDVTQGKLSMGFTTGINPVSEEYYALMVANSIFGGGAHSKLFNNVREKLSLCYYASSSLERYKTVLVVNAGIEFENYQKAYDEILAQLENIKNGEISELEYVSSINAIVNSLKTCKDDQYAMQSFNLSEHILNTGKSLDDCIEEIKKVTPEQAADAAKKIRLDTVYFLKGEDSK